MQNYVFKEGPLVIRAAKDADPQKIGETLSALAESAGGELTPEAVVEHARDPKSILHPHFDWDDASAAENWRTEQARGLIRCIRIWEIGSNSEPSRAFLSISDNGTSYRTLQEIRSSGDLQKKLLAAAERDLESFTVRYRVLKDICAIVETAKKVAKAKRTKNETREAA